MYIQENTEVSAVKDSAAHALNDRALQPSASSTQLPWRVLGDASCPCCGARYGVSEAPLGDVIAGWFRCTICMTTIASWAGPAARAYTLR